MAQRLRRPTRPQSKAATAGFIALPNAFRRLDKDAAGREVGSGNAGVELGCCAGGVLDEMQERGAKLADVMRRDAGRHPDGNARCAVGEQVRKAGGQDDRLAVLAVISLAEVDCIVADTVEHRAASRLWDFGDALLRRAVELRDDSFEVL